MRKEVNWQIKKAILPSGVDRETRSALLLTFIPQEVSISTRDLALTNENSRRVRPEIDEAFPLMQRRNYLTPPITRLILEFVKRSRQNKDKYEVECIEGTLKNKSATGGWPDQK